MLFYLTVLRERSYLIKKRCKWSLGCAGYEYRRVILYHPQALWLQYQPTADKNDLMWAVSSMNDEMKALYHTDKMVVQGDLNTILDE